jgi:hypothetical protein
MTNTQTPSIDMTRNTLATFAALATIALATPAAAQDAPRSSTQGLFVAGGANTGTLTRTEGWRSNTGFGANVLAGYGLSERFAVTVGSSGTHLRDAAGSCYTLGHVDLLGRYSFAGSHRAWVPYLGAGLTVRSAQFAADGASDDARISRTDPTLSAVLGLHVFLRTNVAIDAWSSNSLGALTGDGCQGADSGPRTCAISSRTGVGLAWFPGAQ